MLRKKGDKMMFAKLEDLVDSMEVVAFSSTYSEFKDVLVDGTCIAVRGSVSHRNGSPSIVIEKVKKL